MSGACPAASRASPGEHRDAHYLGHRAKRLVARYLHNCVIASRWHRVHERIDCFLRTCVHDDLLVADLIVERHQIAAQLRRAGILGIA